MEPTQQSFDPRLMEKLIPWVKKPIAEHAIVVVASDFNAAKKLQLKGELLACWQAASAAMDHRALSRNTVRVSFGEYTHYISSRAMGEFNRQRKLYENCYTVGLKQSVDSFAAGLIGSKLSVVKECFISGWRLGPSKVKDFRRRNGERLMLVSPVVANFAGQIFKGKTTNISNGGALVCFAKSGAPQVAVDDPIALTFNELCRQYELDSHSVRYQVVNVDDSGDVVRVAMKRMDQNSKSEFDQLIAHLMNGHKRRNKLDVDNTVTALTARCQNLAATCQLEGQMVLSHHQQRYHLLVSQGQSLLLQVQLQLASDLIPFMVEHIKAKQVKLFLAWMDAKEQMHCADLTVLKTQAGKTEVVNLWRQSPWHKAFLLSADDIDPQLAELGTSLPCDVAPIVSKLNAPLPVKVARLSQELAKMTLIEDVSEFAQLLTSKCPTVETNNAAPYRLKLGKGQLRQVPFDKQALSEFEGTFRIGLHCKVKVHSKQWVSVTGYTNTQEAMLTLPLEKYDLGVGDELTVVWSVDGHESALLGVIDDYSDIHQSAKIKWLSEGSKVSGVFRQLEIMCVLNRAITADIHANKLDFALRNLILCNLPKASIFAKVKDQNIALCGLTATERLPEVFSDEHYRTKLDVLFSPVILKQIASGGVAQRDLLLVNVQLDEQGEVESQRVRLSDCDDYASFYSQYQALSMSGELYVFVMDVSEPRMPCDDAIVNIEYKYVSHYNPAKAKKLDETLAYDLCIGLLDISKVFKSLMA